MARFVGIGSNKIAGEHRCGVGRLPDHCHWLAVASACSEARCGALPVPVLQQNTATVPAKRAARGCAARSAGVVPVSGEVVEREVGLWEFELEEVAAPGQVQRRGLGRRTGAGFEEIGDVVGGERAVLEGVVERAGGGLGAVDLAEGDDFAYVMDGVESALLEFAVVLVGAGGERDEALEQALGGGLASLFEQGAGVVRDARSRGGARSCAGAGRRGGLGGRCTAGRDSSSGSGAGRRTRRARSSGWCRR